MQVEVIILLSEAGITSIKQLVKFMIYKNQINKDNTKIFIPMVSKEYYKEIIREFLSQHHPAFYKELKNDNELEETLNWRAERFLRMMENSSNPQDEKEIYYQEMLTF
jgi:hypothetical protein